MAILKHFLSFFQDVTSFMGVACSVLFLYCLIKQIRWLKKLPPGPWGYPIVGVMYSIKKEFHLFLMDFIRDFGNVFSFKMGTQTIVVLSDHKTIKKAFQNKDFTARPKTELTDLLGGYGVINSEGDLWKSQRRFLINHKLGMRHWGPGMGQIEQRIEHETSELLKNFSQHSNKPVNPASMINCAVSNVICSMIMNTRFEHTNVEFQRFMKNFDEGFELFKMTGALIYLPFLKHLMPNIGVALGKLKNNREEMLQFVKKIIDDHKAQLDPTQPKDLIDSYLITIEKTKNDTSNNNENANDIFHGVDPEQQLEQIILDLFSAGVETLKTSVLWAIVYMLHHPEIMEKVQTELDTVVGSDRLPNVQDMAQLTYTKATIYEIMRRSSVVPMGTTHSTVRNVEFEGFTIPKNAHVIPLLHAVHMNPEHWDQPEEFRPERFLNEDHSCIVKPEHFLPFGIGQRMCLGDQLAEKEFFMFFASLLHCFELKNPEGQPLPNLRGVAAVTVTPNDFEVICVPRLNVASLTKEQIFTDSTNLWAQMSSTTTARIYG